MENEHLVKVLIEKRSEIATLIIGLEKQLGSHRASLVHLDATLKILSPDIKVAQIRSKRPAYARSGYFALRELSQRCQDAVRIAGVKGVSAEELGVQGL